MLNKTDKKITKTQLTITLLLVLFISITGTTYAYFAISGNNNSITGDLATVNLTLNVTRVFPKATSDNTGVMIPQLSTNAALESALKGGCVDANKNVACQVYRIEVSNQGGNATQVVDGKIDFYSDPAMTKDISTTMPNLKWKKITSANETTPTNSVLGSFTNNTANTTGTKFVTDLTMVKNSTFTYYIIVWINEINVNQEDQSTQEMEKSFYGKVSIDSSNGTGITGTFQA